MASKDIKRAAAIFQDHMKVCPVCKSKNRVDICSLGLEYLDKFYQAVLDEIALETLEPPKKPPQSEK